MVLLPTPIPPKKNVPKQAEETQRELPPWVEAMIEMWWDVQTFRWNESLVPRKGNERWTELGVYLKSWTMIRWTELATGFWWAHRGKGHRQPCFVVEARCFWRLQVLTDEHAWQRFWQDCVCWRYGVEYTLNPKWKQRVRICQGCIVSEPTVALQSWCSKNANFLGWFSKNCAWSFACTVPSDAWFSGVLSYLMAFFDCFLSHRWNIVVRLRGLPVIHNKRWINADVPRVLLFSDGSLWLFGCSTTRWMFWKFLFEGPENSQQKLPKNDNFSTWVFAGKQKNLA